MARDYDFIGFSFNGKHCLEDFEMYRTSDGSRYNDDLVPTMNDKIIDVPGGDGQFFFGTNYKTRQFSISVAFDHLTEIKYNQLKQWLNGKGIHDLVFDEKPYKVYSAKITGTPQFKTLCFTENDERIYKGEGTIQFICYHPFAHTPNTTKSGGDGRQLSAYVDALYPTKREWQEGSGLPYTHIDGKNYGDIPAPFVVEKSSVNQNTEFEVGSCSIKVLEACSDFKWDSKTGLVMGKVGSETNVRPIKYTGKSYGTIPTSGATLNLPTGATIQYNYWYY